MSSQPPPELPPPRISDKNFKMPSVDVYIEPTSSLSAAAIKKRNEESFADFTQFPDSVSGSKVLVYSTCFSLYFFFDKNKRKQILIK